MVAFSPNITLTLDALGSNGALLPSEVKAALAHSLPLKEAELNISGLTLWGRISTLDGRDYLIAHAMDFFGVVEDKVASSALYFFSQDGIEWSDLAEVSMQDKKLAANMKSLLTGDPQSKHFWPPKTEDEEAGEDDAAVDKAKSEHITELRRLRTMVDSINQATNLAPVGCDVINSDGRIVRNPLFSGLTYSDKLEAYYHQHMGPNGGTAAEDVRGSWALIDDKFRGVTVCRNLLYVGYTFFYNSVNNTWGGFYHGDGLQNSDLIFML